jgi:two-component system sensor histidine kinase RegB
MIAAATLLVFYQYPLPWLPGQSLQLPLLYVAGVWVALVLGAVFIAAYAFRVAEEARRLSDALTATELVLAREQHLTQLDGLAAAAAHELGTPLATITVVTKELRRMGPQEGPISEDIALLEQEAQRCRAILGKLTSLGEDEGAGPWLGMSLRQLLEEVVEPSRNFGVSLETKLWGEGAEPMCVRNPGILYGLGNLVENAVDFARDRVKVDAQWTMSRVRISIEDDGPGFSPEVLAKLGEPYVTTRGSDRRSKFEEGGLGLGLFIAKTLLERSGAALSMANAEAPATGARIAIVWPRDVLESNRTQASQPVENSANSPTLS